MKKLIIERKGWQRGKGGDDTKLLNAVGKCCLGFHALNEGFTEVEIRGEYFPEYLTRTLSGVTVKAKNDSHLLTTTPEGRQLAVTNDSRSLTETDREKQITKLFAKIGREVEFIN